MSEKRILEMDCYEQKVLANILNDKRKSLIEENKDNELIDKIILSILVKIDVNLFVSSISPIFIKFVLIFLVVFETIINFVFSYNKISPAFIP